MSKNITIQSSLALFETDGWKDMPQQEKDCIRNASKFDINGTEEQVVRKMTLQVCSVIAMYYSNQNNTDFIDELKKLKVKYNI